MAFYGRRWSDSIVTLPVIQPPGNFTHPPLGTGTAAAAVVMTEFVFSHDKVSLLPTQKVRPLPGLDIRTEKTHRKSLVRYLPLSS